MVLERQSIENIDQLFKEFDHPNPYINSQACLAMAKYYPDESINRLINNLDESNIDLRRKSVRCLSSFGSQVVLPIYSLFYSTNDKTIRTSCLKVLVKVASDASPDNLPKEIFDIINTALEDENYEIILTVISLLRELNSLGIPFLKKLCRDYNILKAKAAVTAISELKDSSILPFLIELANDNSIDRFIRDSACDIIKSNK